MTTRLQIRLLLGLTAGIVCTVLVANPGNTSNTTLAGDPGDASMIQSARPDPDWKPPVFTAAKPSSPVSPKVAKRLEERWGVELVSLTLTAEGFMMDFRFRVLDAEKALPLFDQRNQAAIEVSKSSVRLPVPGAEKIGSFRITNRGNNIRADRIYYMMFANPDRHVRPGDQVDLSIGEFRVASLSVQ